MLHLSNDANELKYCSSANYYLTEPKYLNSVQCSVLLSWHNIEKVGARWHGGAEARSDSPSQAMQDCTVRTLFVLTSKSFSFLEGAHACISLSHLHIWYHTLHIINLHPFIPSRHAEKCLHCQTTRGCVCGCFCHFLQISASSPFYRLPLLVSFFTIDFTVICLVINYCHNRRSSQNKEDFSSQSWVLKSPPSSTFT